MLRFPNSLIHTLLVRAREADLRLYIVGGSVRDVLLGLSDFADIDMVYDGDFEAFQQALFKEVPFKRIAFDKKGFHTERLCFRKLSIDFQPIVNGQLEDDARHRDFTVNALFLEYSADDEFTLIDTVGGFADIDARRLRCVSDHAFEDDPLRIVRMFRMAAALGFEYTEEELHVAKTSVGGIQALARERIRSELEKIIPVWSPSVAADMHAIGLDIALFGFPVDHSMVRKITGVNGALFDLFYNHGKAAVLPEWGKAMTFGARECTVWHVLHQMASFPQQGSDEAFFAQFHTVHPLYLDEILLYYTETNNRHNDRVRTIARHSRRCVDGTRIAREFGVSGAALGKVSDALHCIQMLYDTHDPERVVALYREKLAF